PLRLRNGRGQEQTFVAALSPDRLDARDTRLRIEFAPVGFLQHAGIAQRFFTLHAALDAHAGEVGQRPGDAFVNALARLLRNLDFAERAAGAGKRNSGAQHDALSVERAAFDVVAF